MGQVSIRIDTVFLPSLVRIEGSAVGVLLAVILAVAAI
jgi:hypothetical protein